MTIGEIGEIAIYAARMTSIANKLRPAVIVRVSDVPPNTLPSYVLERKLAGLQAKENRVSGSDLGDGHIAPLALYCDGIEVDKRTLHHLKKIQREPESRPSWGQFLDRRTTRKLPNALNDHGPQRVAP